MKTILLVEDEFGIAAALALLLEDEGYRVISAANGREALARLIDTVPDLVVTDLMMPLMDGAALGQALKANPSWQGIPIVMMSAVPETTLRQQFDGYTVFLRKPFPIPTLFEQLARILADLS